MYIPKHFEVTEEDEIHAFIAANAFGQLISNANGQLLSTHLPFLISDDKTKLLCHLAKQNPHLKDIEAKEVLITFQGAHDYISPSWYASPGVPTWNYQAAHVYGKCRTFDDPEALMQLVDTLTDKYESDLAVPWHAKYSPSMLGAIVGVEIEIRDIQCKYKLSQNRSIIDRTQVIDQLKNIGSNQLAEAMQRTEL
jgi:transcriptional regulator